MGVAESRLLEARGNAEALNEIAKGADMCIAICARGDLRVRAFAYALTTDARSALYRFGLPAPSVDFEPPEIGDLRYLADAMEASLRTGRTSASAALAILLAGYWRPFDACFELRLLRTAEKCAIPAFYFVLRNVANLMMEPGAVRVTHAEYLSEAAYRRGNHCASLLLLGFSPARNSLECGCVYCEVSGEDTLWQRKCPELPDESDSSAFGAICLDVAESLGIQTVSKTIKRRISRTARRIMWAAYPDADPSAAEVRARLRPCPPRRGPEGGCSVCLETRPLALAVPCGHFSACFRCAARLGDSPCVLCRAPVTSHISTWTVPPPAV